MNSRPQTAACPRCVIQGKPWEGSDPQCAFPTGDGFTSKNWNCGTMNALRGLVEDKATWSEDYSAALLPDDGDFLLLVWYKRRGRTEEARMIHSCQDDRPFTLEAAERILRNAER